MAAFVQNQIMVNYYNSDRSTMFPCTLYNVFFCNIDLRLLITYMQGKDRIKSHRKKLSKNI